MLVLSTLANGLANGFYLLVVGSVFYFLHKVAWFFRYRRVQAEMVARALEKLHEQADTTVVRWDRGADASWSEALTGVAAERGDSQADYVTRVELELAQLESGLQQHEPVAAMMVQAVRKGPSEDIPPSVELLRLPQRGAEPRVILLPLDFPLVPEPNVPPKDMLKLEMRSRYGVGRRLLAFLLGVADVVYTSRHVVRMSQNPTAPIGVLLRRMSLVLLIVLALVVDIGFGVRKFLLEKVTEVLPQYLDLGSTANPFVSGVIALGLWLTGYGVLYVGLYLFLRHRSGRHLRQLAELQTTLPERIADIRDEHLEGLYAWTAEYGRTLDDAASLTMRQAEMLVQWTSHRLRRRVASPILLSLAQEVSALFFAELPEAATKLQDDASSHKHTFMHAVWPRQSEMRYQIVIAQHRYAWSDIELTVNTLRGERPDPELAGQLWRSLVRYARMFPDVVPADLFARLQDTHGQTVSTIVDDTNVDLDDLGVRLSELADALQLTIEAASPLVESRIELSTRSMESAVASFVSEALRIRERARVEAMAFEI